MFVITVTYQCLSLAALLRMNSVSNVSNSYFVNAACFKYAQWIVNGKCEKEYSVSHI